MRGQRCQGSLPKKVGFPLGSEGGVEMTTAKSWELHIPGRALKHEVHGELAKGV